MKEKNDDYSGPLTSLPVDLPKVDRLQRRRSCQNPSLLQPITLLPPPPSPCAPSLEVLEHKDVNNP